MVTQKFNKPVKVLFKITSECNQSCAFCLEKTFIDRRRPRLEKDEIVINYEHLNKRFIIDSVILSGGEPTLHPEYFSILDFFRYQRVSLKIITNLFQFNENSFSKKHLLHYTRNKDYTLYGSINTLPLRYNEPNISGLQNILEHNIPVSIIIVVYKNNLKEVPELIYYLNNLFSFSRVQLRLELRLVYAAEVRENVIEQVPKDFEKVANCIEDSLRLANDLGIKVVLWNFPVCYLKDSYDVLRNDIKQRKENIMVKIDKDNQLDNFKVRDFNHFFFKDNRCRLCKCFRSCSGINKIYIDDFGFPKLEPITK